MQRLRRTSTSAGSPVAPTYSVYLRSQHEVTFGQAVDRVGKDLDARSSPREMDVGVVPFRLRDLADLVHEGEGLTEILEAEVARKVVPLDDLPAFELREERFVSRLV